MIAFLVMFFFRFFNLKKDFELKERTCPVSFRVGRQLKSRRNLASMLWFEEYVNSMADSMPNEVKKHLPSCLTKKEVYANYQQSFKDGDIQCKKALSYTQFNRMWTKEFSNVTIPEVNLLFQY